MKKVLLTLSLIFLQVTFFSQAIAVTIQDDTAPQTVTLRPVGMLHQKKIFNEALTHQNAGNYKLALRNYKHVLKIQERNPDAQFHVGEIYEYHVRKGLVPASHWYKLAEANGYPNAKIALARVLHKLAPANDKEKAD